MIPYDDDAQTLITVLDVQYRVEVTSLQGRPYCDRCLLNAPEYKLLFPNLCFKVPCAWYQRKAMNNAALVEVVDASV